ncbi:MAG: ribbon-helix-helix protein, CopG family [Candidatus Altiarchaeota archaeon]|nr:ribbon-helix-helix protein, CopG family [Candidatus Altiarchaeota archaeon]
MDADMVVVNVRMPKKTVKAIERESGKLGYPNKSEYIREAVRRMINPEIKEDVMEEVIRRSLEAKSDFLTHEEVARKIRK